MIFIQGVFLAALTLSARTVVDPAAFGFDPAAKAEVNVAALQKALDGGSRTVRIIRPGTYDVDRTVYIDSHTKLEFAKGAVLRKVASYSSVLINRGAHCYGHDTDIEVTNPNGLSIWWETGNPYCRAVHPEIKPKDYPIIDITLERCHTKYPGGPLIPGSSCRSKTAAPASTISDLKGRIRCS